MPIYEYEPTEHDCQMCPNRISAIQAIGDAPLAFCPHCGMDVKKVVSRATFAVPKIANADRAGEKGLTTFRRVEKGKWERIGGPGVDMIVGTDEDMAAIEAEKTCPKVLDLDEPM